MKAVIAVLCVLVVGLAAGGAFVYTDSTKRIDTLNAELAASKAQGAKLEADLTNSGHAAAALQKQLDDTKAEESATQKDLADIKAGAAALQTKLAQETNRADKLDASLSETNAKLAESLAAGGKASKQSDVLSTLLAKRTALEKLVNDQLFSQAQAIKHSQDSLCSNPSREAFADYKASLDKALATAAQAKPMISELTDFMASNAETLSSSKDVIADITTRLARINKEFPGLESGLRAARDSCREVKMGVSSKEGWQSGNASAERGEIAAISASGTWMYYPTRGNQVGAQGEELGKDVYKVAEALPNGALITRVHGDEVAFMATPAFQADRDGKLEFRINDTQVGDNQGTIDIVIWIFKPVSAM